MSSHARHMPPARPAPVAVHDDGDMVGKTRRIEPQVSRRFLAVHPRRNRVSQGDLSKSKLTQGFREVQSHVLSASRKRSPREIKKEPITSMPRRLGGIVLRSLEL